MDIRCKQCNYKAVKERYRSTCLECGALFHNGCIKRRKTIEIITKNSVICCKKSSNGNVKSSEKISPKPDEKKDPKKIVPKKAKIFKPSNTNRPKRNIKPPAKLAESIEFMDSNEDDPEDTEGSTSYHKKFGKYTSCEESSETPQQDSDNPNETEKSDAGEENQMECSDSETKDNDAVNLLEKMDKLDVSDAKSKDCPEVEEEIQEIAVETLDTDMVIEYVSEEPDPLASDDPIILETDENLTEGEFYIEESSPEQGTEEANSEAIEEASSASSEVSSETPVSCSSSEKSNDNAAPESIDSTKKQVKKKSGSLPTRKSMRKPVDKNVPKANNKKKSPKSAPAKTNTKASTDTSKIEIKVEESSEASGENESASKPENKTKKPDATSANSVKKKVTKSISEKPKKETKKSKTKVISSKIVPKKGLGKDKKKKKEDSDDENSIRRSSRIKKISSKKKKSQGKGLVKKESSEDPLQTKTTNPGNVDDKSSLKDSQPFLVPPPQQEYENKPVKVKSRWRRSSELEMSANQQKSFQSNSPIPSPIPHTNIKKEVDEEVEKRLKQFIHLKENIYLTDRISCKEAKKMVCDCFLTEEEIKQGEYGCGEDCLNRLLMIECGSLCTVNDRCTNKRFQKALHASCEAFNTHKKGIGIRARANIPYGEFILEYVGEVLGKEEFETRAEEYSKDKNQHYYFMALRADAVIDATQKGNISRFINHSCDPNAETQKWTVNGELRIGFFSTRTILAGEEITFDYQFQRYGKEAQKCFCEAETCRGWLGEEPDDDDDEEEEEDDEEEEEEIKELKVHVEQIEPGVIVQPVKDLPTIMEVVKESEVKGIITPGVPEELKASEENKENVVQVEKKPKEKKIKKKPIKDIFEDLVLDDEISTLQETGLKNQAHTLKLSRLMVRAKEIAQRTKLLKLLKRGELPCRRLFLDYHGLRLIHGWMTDVQHLCKEDEKYEYLRLEILQTLAVLPISNKTMLQDSKVLPTVEKWAISEKPAESPSESESSSPKVEEISQPEIVREEQKEVKPLESDDECEIRRSVGMDLVHKPIFKVFAAKNIAEELSMIFDDDDIQMEVEREAPEVKEVLSVKSKVNEYDIFEEILSLAGKLLEEWANLKEVFRIPKKERIEQMKEHEREADKRYKALSLEQENNDKKRDNRYRSMSKSSGEERRRSSKGDDRYSSRKKDDRRRLYNIQLEQANVERRRKHQELWRQHVKNCMIMGTDPKFTAPYDPTRGYQCIWNPKIRQWQNFAVPDQNSMYSPNISMQNTPNISMQQMQNTNFPYMPNMPQAPNHLPQPPINHMSQAPINHLQQAPPNHVPQMLNHPSNHLPPNNLQHPLNRHNVQEDPSLSSIVIPTNIPPPNMLPPKLKPTPGLPLTSQNLANMPPQQGIIPQNVPQATVPSNLGAQTMSSANMGTMPPMPNIPSVPVLPYQVEDVTQVKFMGPIPPPVKLPPKWRCAKDKYGRPYYYHVKIRKSQWEPPKFELEIVNDAEENESDSTSSESSSESSGSSSDDSDSDEIDDETLMMEIRHKFRKMDSTTKLLDSTKKSFTTSTEKSETENRVLPDSSPLLDTIALKGSLLGSEEKSSPKETTEALSSLDKRLMEELGLPKQGEPPAKKRRVGLVKEIIISPRTEQDKLQFKEDVKKYKQNKEMLRKQKEIILQQTKNKVKSSPVAGSSKTHVKKVSSREKLKELEANCEGSKKIKDTFRSQMATVMVGILNVYRKHDCKEGRITNTDDFKHLARKLTHFVMLKELKQCNKIEDLTCNDNVKGKAKEFVRKYMSKYGEVYQRPPDDPDF